MTSNVICSTRPPQVPHIATVAVEIRKCMRCLSYAWASDNWRETMVFNFNNYCLIEVSVLYRCLDEFIAGTPIETFFTHLLQPLTTNTCWLSQNPYLGKRCVPAFWCHNFVCLFLRF